MNIDITEIIVAMIGVLAAIITGYVIPWLKAKTGEKRWEQLQTFAWVAVNAAEQLGMTGQLSGKKLEYAMTTVEEMLAKAGLTFNKETIRAAIEAAVRELPPVVTIKAGGTE